MGGRIDTVLVLLDIRCLLPRWVGQESAQRRMRDAWEAYLGRLAAHERTHGGLAKQAAQALEQALRDLPAERRCEAVGRAANLIAEAATALNTSDGNDDIYITYDITVPAGGSVAIVNFIIFLGGLRHGCGEGRNLCGITAGAAGQGSGWSPSFRSSEPCLFCPPARPPGFGPPGPGGDRRTTGSRPSRPPVHLLRPRCPASGS